MEWYIDKAYKSGSDYYVKGQEMPYCTKSGSKKDLHSVTSHGYVAALGPIRCYVTRSVLATLKGAGVFEALRPQLLGVVPNDYAKKYDRGGQFPYCWELIEGIVPSPLPSYNALGEIVSIDVPASASEGDSINLCASIKNIGGTKAMFFLRFYDGSTMVRETSPGGIDPGQTIENICELFTMPDHAWSGKIELFRMEQ